MSSIPPKEALALIKQIDKLQDACLTFAQALTAALRDEREAASEHNQLPFEPQNLRATDETVS